jgi:hypothetical protein
MQKQILSLFLSDIQSNCSYCALRDLVPAYRNCSGLGICYTKWSTCQWHKLHQPSCTSPGPYLWIKSLSPTNLEMPQRSRSKSFKEANFSINWS